jgi:hypothetical protein
MHFNKVAAFNGKHMYENYSTEKPRNDWGKNQSHYDVDQLVSTSPSKDSDGYKLPEEPLTAESLNKIYDSLKWSKIYHGSEAGLRKADVLYLCNSSEEHEYIRCSSDPLYFIETHCKVMIPQKGMTNIKLRDYQVQLVKDYTENKLNIYAVSRQVGMTTILSLLALWEVMYNQEKSIALFNDRITNSIEMMDKIREAYRNLPYYLKAGVRAWSQKEIKFDNDSRIIVASTGHESAGTWIINDYAFMLPKKAEDLHRSIFPRIAARKGDRLFISSTPNGINHFYELFKNAEEGKNEFNARRIAWDRVAGRDEHWKSLEIGNLGGEELFRREYDLGDLKETKKRPNRKMLLLSK